MPHACALMIIWQWPDRVRSILIVDGLCCLCTLVLFDLFRACSTTHIAKSPDGICHSARSAHSVSFLLVSAYSFRVISTILHSHYVFAYQNVDSPRLCLGGHFHLMRPMLSALHSCRLYCADDLTWYNIIAHWSRKWMKHLNANFPSTESISQNAADMR